MSETWEMQYGGKQVILVLEWFGITTTLKTITVPEFGPPAIVFYLDIEQSNKGKVPAPLDDCGGKECGACKTCYDKLRKTLEQSKSSLMEVQKDYQPLQVSERTLKENDCAPRKQI